MTPRQKCPHCPECNWPLDGVALGLERHYDCASKRERAEAVRQAQAERLSESASTTHLADATTENEDHLLYYADLQEEFA